MHQVRREWRQGKVSAIVIGLIVACAGLLLFMLVGGVVLIHPAIQAARDVAKLQASKESLKVIGIAAHKHESAFKLLPPIRYEGGNPEFEPMSWRTSLLPFLDEETLFQSYNQHAKWDDEANREVVATQVKAFISPSASLPKENNPRGLAMVEMNELMQLDYRGLRLGYFVDGTANTIFAGEINNAYPAWADPDSVRSLTTGLGSRPDQFGGHVRSGLTNFLMVDGSVRPIAPNVDQAVLDDLATPNGAAPRRQANATSSGNAAAVAVPEPEFATAKKIEELEKEVHRLQGVQRQYDDLQEKNSKLLLAVSELKAQADSSQRTAELAEGKLVMLINLRKTYEDLRRKLGETQEPVGPITEEQLIAENRRLSKAWNALAQKQADAEKAALVRRLEAEKKKTGTLDSESQLLLDKLRRAPRAKSSFEN